MADELPTDEEPETGTESSSEAPPANDVEAMQRALAKANAEAMKARTELKALRPLADKARELEDSQKSELQKLQESLEAAKAEATSSAAALQRYQVALESAPEGVSLADIRWVAGRAQGSTPEELAADAADLFSRLAPAAPAATPPAANGGQRPVESLRPGALPVTPKPAIQDQIAEAEAAGDHNLAGHLKVQWLAELRKAQP